MTDIQTTKWQSKSSITPVTQKSTRHLTPLKPPLTIDHLKKIQSQTLPSPPPCTIEKKGKTEKSRSIIHPRLVTIPANNPTSCVLLILAHSRTVHTSNTIPVFRSFKKKEERRTCVESFFPSPTCPAVFSLLLARRKSLYTEGPTYIPASRPLLFVRERGRLVARMACAPRAHLRFLSTEGPESEGDKQTDRRASWRRWTSV